jgi:hypothetical protein
MTERDHRVTVASLIAFTLGILKPFAFGRHRYAEALEFGAIAHHVVVRACLLCPTNDIWYSAGHLPDRGRPWLSYHLISQVMLGAGRAACMLSGCGVALLIVSLLANTVE